MAVNTKFHDRKKDNPIYQKLSDLNRELRIIREDELRKKLEKLDLNKSGSDIVVYKRYKQHMRNTLIKADPSPPPELARSLQCNPLGFEYLVIVDFEATCEERNPPDYVHEIIEFPALLFNIRDLKVEDRFHSYCRPVLNPRLSEFCVKLTGIKQAKVDSSRSFKEVFQAFTEWLESKQLGTTHNFSIATDCPWDIKNCLFPQCALSGVSFPDYAAKWIDIRKLFISFYQVQPQGVNLSYMLSALGMEFEGREHCGLDDAQNISRIAAQLIRDGCALHYNRFISSDIIDRIFKKKR